MKKFNLSKGLIVGLLTFALCIVAFAAVGASADEAPVAPSAVTATYSYESNTITAAQNAVVYVLKQAKGNTIKKGAAATGSITAGQNTSLVDLKVKGTTKDVFLYVCDKEFEAEGKVDANLVIKAQAAKKIVGKIDYTKADIVSEDDPNFTKVLSISATDSNKKAIENPACIWSKEIDGTYSSSTTFTGTVLAKMLEDGGGVIYVKMIGNNSPAQFASKAIKVKIAKPAKAPKVKYDAKKDTFALKNGFDFAVAFKTNDKYSAAIETWTTILPVLKDATAKTSEASIVATSSFTPCDKKDADVKANTTQYKFKAVSMKTIIAALNSRTDNHTIANGDFILAVRKSATAKKPASEVTYIEIAAQTKNPIVYTASNVDNQFDVATVADFDKKGFTIGTVANYNGANGTIGYDDSFELKKDNAGADKNPAAYEFCVINAADEATIDWTTVSWKKLDPAKTKINGKLKSKYTKIGASSPTEAVLKASAAPATEQARATFMQTLVAGTQLPDGVNTLLLVRRAGVKGDTPIRPSEYIKLFVVKDGKNYILYSTKDNGAEAFAYTIKFFRYAKTMDGQNEVYKWVEDTTIPAITGWGNASTEYVDFPAVEKADFFSLNDGLTATVAKKTVLGGDTANKDKYAIAVEDEDVTYNFAINEYANVTFTVQFGTGTGNNFAKLDGKTQTVAKIIDGKVATYDSQSKDFKVAENATVSAYVGTAIENITLQSIVAPSGYGKSSGDSLVAVADGTNYSDAALVEGKAGATILATGEVEVVLKQSVYQKYTITVDANGGTWSDGSTKKTFETNESGKIADEGLFRDGAAVVPPACETENKVNAFAKLSTVSAGTDAVPDTTVFSKDMTIYVIYHETNAE